MYLLMIMDVVTAVYTTKFYSYWSTHYWSVWLSHALPSLGTHILVLIFVGNWLNKSEMTTPCYARESTFLIGWLWLPVTYKYRTGQVSLSKRRVWLSQTTASCTPINQLLIPLASNEFSSLGLLLLFSANCSGPVQYIVCGVVTLEEEGGEGEEGGFCDVFCVCGLYDGWSSCKGTSVWLCVLDGWFGVSLYGWELILTTSSFEGRSGSFPPSSLASSITSGNFRWS